MPICYQTGADHLARLVAQDLARAEARVDAVMSRHRRGVEDDRPDDEPLEPLVCPACRQTYDFGSACPVCDVLLISASWVGAEEPRRIPAPPPWWIAPAGRLASLTLATVAIVVWVGIFITVYPRIDHVVTLSRLSPSIPRSAPRSGPMVREATFVHGMGNDVSLRTLDIEGVWLPRLLVTLDDPAASGDLELQLQTEGLEGATIGSCHRRNCHFRKVGPDWGRGGYSADDPVWIGAGDFVGAYEQWRTAGFIRPRLPPEYPGEIPPDPLGSRDHPWPTELIALGAPAAGAYAISLHPAPENTAPAGSRDVRVRVYAAGELLLDEIVSTADLAADLTIGRVTFPGATLIPS
jgi:hypothetical protein